MTDRFPIVDANKDCIRITCIARFSFTKHFLTYPHREFIRMSPCDRELFMQNRGDSKWHWKRTKWECDGFTCGVEYVSKFSPGALKHFHKHLKDPRCTGDLKKKLMKFAKENGIMKVLMKRGYVRSEIVAAWDMLQVAEAISLNYFWNLSLTSTFLTFVIFLT